MYGLWLYKELKTEYGNCKVELYRKGYTASAVEIGGFVGNSLNLALENLDTITAPIGKSVCSFAIYDTAQIEYDDLFSPDATAFKVVVSTKVDGGEYNPRWSGYVTPDFFAENLSFRTPISISARDNIGYLNDVDFDLDTATITVRELIQAAFNRIAEDYPMSLSFVTQKQTEEGILAIDATISTYLLREMSWYEALETVLHDLGLQMRWVDNNTIAVLDISQLGENFGIQRFNFIERSGYREILPAWRELSQKQDYGLIENFFRGRISEENLTFVKEEQVVIDGYNTSTMRYYSPKNWLGNGLTINYNDYFFSVGGVMSESERNRIYFTGISKDTTAYINKFIGWRQPVYKSNNAMKVSFKALNSIQVVSQYSLQGMPTLQTFGPYPPGTAQFGLKVNVLLHTATKTYIMRYKWEELNADETDAINFVLPVLQGNANEEECVINLGNIPYDGELELRIYGWYFIEATNWTSMPLNAVSYITDVVYTYDGSATGQDAKVVVAELHNIKEDRDYSFGQVPLDSGGINAYAGGLFKANGDELVGFKRNVDGSTYPLLELVGREIIHFNKRNYTKLSGTVKNLAAEPLTFNKLLVYKGKNYLPYACSLDVISNTMNITTMQEVEPYMTQSFVEIKSELVTGGGATISGGNNTALQYSAEAGNAKRISELNNASESEKREAYVVIDNTNWPESKKVPFFDIVGLNEAQVGAYLEENKYAKQSWVNSELEKYWKIDADGNLRTTFNIVVEGGGVFGTGSTSGGGTSGGLGSVTIKTEGGIEYKSNSNGVVTVPNWITAASLPTSLPASDVYAWAKKSSLAIADVPDLSSKYLPLTGGTINGTLEINHNGTYPLIVNGADSYSILQFSARSKRKAEVGWLNDSRGDFAILLNVNSIGALSVNKHGAYFTPNTSDFATYPILHTGNYADTTDKRYLQLSGGILNSNSVETALQFKTSNSVASTGLIRNASSAYGFYLWNSNGGRLGLREDGTPHYNGNTLYHSGNFNPADYLPKSGGELGDGTNSLPLKLKGDSTQTRIGFRIGSNSLAYLSYMGGENWIVTNEGWGKTLNLLHSSNYSDYALPLSGGKTITGNFTLADNVNILNSKGYGIFVYDATNTTVGIGTVGAKTKIRSNDSALIHERNGTDYAILDQSNALTLLTNGNTIIHSGNISSQSVSYASRAGVLKISTQQDADTAENGQMFSTTYNTGIPSGGSSYLNGLTFASNNDSAYKVQLGIDFYGKVFSRSQRNSTWYDWVQLAHITDNVASATKLQTARTIWGQSFDGTANVDGWFRSTHTDFRMHYNTDTLFLQAAPTALILGEGTAATISTYILGKDIRFGSKLSSNAMIIANSGNVLIGTTTDNGNKLQVNGDVHCNAIIRYDSNTGYLFGSRNTALGFTDGGALVYAYGNTPISMYTNGLERMRVLANGNVLIGTTNDRTNIKLNVNGTVMSILSSASNDAMFYGERTDLGYNIGFGIGTSSNRGIYDSTLGWCFKIDTSHNLTILSHTVSGNLTVTGGGAFGSDVRYKDIINYTNIDLATIADAPLFTFKWTDREDKVVHLGTSAQYWLDTQFRDAVNTTNKDFYHLDYGALAVGIGISVARKVVNHEERIATLEKENRELKEKLNKYETWHN